MKELTIKILAYSLLYSFDFFVFLLRLLFLPQRLLALMRNKRQYDKEMESANDPAMSN